MSNKAQEENVIMIRKRSFSLRKPIFSLMDYFFATVRGIVPDTAKARIYKKENGDSK